jgi:hypothetical protein
MYFDDTPYITWNISLIFDSYYRSHQQDPVKALDQIKQDLIAFVNQPNVLTSAKKRAREPDQC